MLFIVIEHFKSRDAAAAVYERFRARGRMLPEGLRYLDSWVETNYERCFQLMECADERLFAEWFAHWQDLIDFELVPVVKSSEAASAIDTSP
jgi:Domain of unknown function (DUF3303)